MQLWGFRVSGVGFKGSGFRVWGSGFKGLRVHGLGLGEFSGFRIVAGFCKVCIGLYGCRTAPYVS